MTCFPTLGEGLSLHRTLALPLSRSSVSLYVRHVTCTPILLSFPGGLVEYGKDVPDRRQQLTVDTAFQHSLIRFIGTMWIVNMVVVGGLLFYVQPPHPQLGPLLTVGAVFGLALTVIVSHHMSHQIAGPIAQVKAALGDVAQGNLDVELRFRNYDYLSDLPDHFNDMVRAWRKRARDDVQRLRAIEAGMDDSPAARERLCALITELEARVGSKEIG